MPSRKEKYTALYHTAGLIRRVGFRRADELLAFLYDWRQFIVAHDRAPDGVEEYIAWTRAFSRRTVYYRLSLLRSAYPEMGPDAVPTDFMQSLLEQVDREMQEHE